ncbi:MAG: hypothetical protein KJ971_04870 [Firmicutes bacterium]|nr:hypothetical protein [Bacillota bacterium]
MKKAMEKNNIKLSYIFMTAFFLLVVGFQWVRISGLNLGYLKPTIDVKVTIIYLLFILFLPIVVLLFIYLSGLFIVTVKIKIPEISSFKNQLYKNISLLNKYNPFNRRLNIQSKYKIMRC